MEWDRDLVFFRSTQLGYSPSSSIFPMLATRCRAFQQANRFFGHDSGPRAATICVSIRQWRCKAVWKARVSGGDTEDFARLSKMRAALQGFSFFCALPS